MRRTENLRNVIYHKRYKEIYRLLFTADLDRVEDYSNWYKEKQDYIDRHRPLWIVAESKILNKRIWITDEWGNLGVDTAQLDLDINSSKYSESHEFNRFKTQTEMAKYLKKLLEPCLIESTELESEEEELC